MSASLAERAWPNQQPIGKRFQMGGPQSPLYEVVGVVGDVRGASLSGNQQFPTVYVPYWRRAFSEVTLAVKTTGDPAATYALVRQTIRRLDSELPIPAMRTMDDVVMASVAPRQFQMRLVLLFGIVALLLAGLGVYGVVSYSVAQRTSETGTPHGARCDAANRRAQRAASGDAACGTRARAPALSWQLARDAQFARCCSMSVRWIRSRWCR